MDEPEELDIAMKKEPRKYKYSDKVYPMIPTSTLESMMGPKRWDRIKKAVRKKYKTDVIFVEHREVPTLRVGSSDGILLGTVRKTERWASSYLKGKA